MAETKLKNQAFTSVDLDAWNAFTPSWTNLTAGTGGSNAGVYCQIGKTIHFRVRVGLGTSPSVGTAPTFTPPVSAASPTTLTFIGQAFFYDASGAFITGIVSLNYNGTAIGISCVNAAGTYTALADVTATVPFTWANSDVMTLTGTYEAA